MKLIQKREFLSFLSTWFVSWNFEELQVHRKFLIVF